MRKRKEDIKRLPLLPLRGLSIFPYMVLHFDVGREKSIRALEEAMINDQLIFLVTQKDAHTDLPTVEDFYEVGTISKIKQLLKLPGDTIRVLVEGINRAEIKDIISEDTYFLVDVLEHQDIQMSGDLELEALRRSVMEVFDEYIKANPKVAPETLITVSDIEDASRFADVIASNLTIKIEEKQEILSLFDVKERMEKIFEILSRELEILEIERKINSRVRKQIDKSQKEYYLREQLKAIQRELGEKEGHAEEIEQYSEKLSKLDVPDEVREKVEKELDRLSKMSQGSPEVGVTRTYLDWIFDLPWNTLTEDNLDIKNARKVLDEDHYGLKKVKERVLEYMAIRQLSNNMKGPILCLVGPPGVGKTSIARSIARAMGRKFARMSLGGVRDEAEIRGHRRTYIGAIPGRIIYSIKQAGSRNPLFLFDEIDKLASDFRGDPASALLEVLDSEQNKEFRDHYLELPFDLSKVMFLTTANSTDTIPPALLDRMEVIYISGYTEEEKLHIAADYLVPKQIKEHSLKDDSVSISEAVIRAVINGYTREAGVRNLEREIANIIRKCATQIVENNKKRVKVTPGNLKKYLGIQKYRHDLINQKNEIGVVTGLAWTSVGGDTLFIEVSVMPGTGKLELTGHLGDVMKESARAGLSYIRSRCEEFGIDKEFTKNTDIHIHVPEGATPKDGPSAGITMTTALVSALARIPVYRDVAMTGEVTLRGRVLPIGGLKEKVLAAKRAGIKKVILPYENEKDIEEIPDTVKKNMTFVLVSDMDEVLSHALIRNEKHDN
ncbi:MAG TPA: endopeptidase La [Bacillota bacterium]|nr:endopeptidase La [Bacillota bacterium]HQE66465.1 endopeptidase La [Bacillota bacterium]HQI16132.1 endopeptidase La [Bacillota bacterium]HQJ36784.1 endopeptidase La [Bacillota bacterium]HRU40594.1 endopeptidase La [Candidatus Diapherotrites archaeon]